jgi:hypothetical protein
LQKPLDAFLQEVHRERFLEIVTRAPSERGDGGFERRVRGHHDHRGAGIEDTGSLEHFEPIETRHHDVGDDDVELLLFDAAQRFFAVPGGGYAVALG